MSLVVVVLAVSTFQYSSPVDSQDFDFSNEGFELSDTYDHSQTGYSATYPQVSELSEHTDYSRYNGTELQQRQY